MVRLTVTIDEDHEATLEDLSGDGGPCESKSGAVRMCIQEYEQADGRVDDLEDEIAELETTVERLRNEKQALIEQRQETKQLAKYVEEERTYREQGLVTRMKWWLTGKPADV